MTDRKIFGLVVRVMGIALAIYGIMDLYSALSIWADAQQHTHPASIAAYSVAGSLAFITGAALVRAEWLVRFAYGRES